MKQTTYLFLAILLAVTVACGGEKPPETTEVIPTLPPELAKGEELYTQNCASCHGEKGAGDGAAAQALNPKPRNYKAPASEWKNGNTVAGITKTLKEGIKGSSMVSYSGLGEESIKAIAEYVEYLAKN